MDTLIQKSHKLITSANVKECYSELKFHLKQFSEKTQIEFTESEQSMISRAMYGKSVKHWKQYVHGLPDFLPEWLKEYEQVFKFPDMTIHRWIRKTEDDKFIFTWHMFIKSWYSFFQEEVPSPGQYFRIYSFFNDDWSDEDSDIED